ncbi:MAG: iron-sulfur cluster assembly scaffold protein [Anaerolineae bacterium]|nr:iron-sulfur cluster assembly scaffold protein [Anaerolineae bacterium]
MSDMYTERLLDHYRQPRNKGHLPQPDLAAEEYNPLCGDRVTFEARLEDGRIVDARFEGRGCALCLGAASILTELVQGRSLEALRLLDQDTFLAELQSPIRAARLKCALLPWLAFRHAAFGEEPWLD